MTDLVIKVEIARNPHLHLIWFYTKPVFTRIWFLREFGFYMWSVWLVLEYRGWFHSFSRLRRKSKERHERSDRDRRSDSFARPSSESRSRLVLFFIQPNHIFRNTFFHFRKIKSSRKRRLSFNSKYKNRNQGRLSSFKFMIIFFADSTKYTFFLSQRQFWLIFQVRN